MFTLINVSKSYKSSNNLKVLNDVNLSFPSKGLVSILGKSGSGKSTLLNLLIGILKPDKGRILYGKKDINKIKNKQEFLNKEIGVLFQHFNLFEEFTAIDNVIIPSLLMGKGKKEAIKLADELFQKYNLSYLKEQKFSSLSGGEKQRVALLRALINKPKVILADEPTGALDSSNSFFIMNELKNISKDRLVIVVTHNEELIKQFEDFRISISDGKVSYLKEDCEEIYKNKLITTNRQKILFSFLKLHLRKHRIRNLISGASIAFSTLCLLLSFGYINGSSASTELYKKQSMLYSYATISKKEIIEVKDSPIKISKLTRPLDTEINFLKENISSIHIENNYQVFLQAYPVFNFDNKDYDDVEFSSIYNFLPSNNLLIAGRFPIEDDFTEVVANEEFVSHFNYSKEDILNHVFKLNIDESIVNVNSKGDLIKDQITFSTNLKIVGIVKEFSYLNSPRVYYSYLGLKDIASDYILNNYSKDLGFDISLDEAITYANGSEPISGYSYALFIDDLSEVDKLFEFKKLFDENGQYDITSNSYVISSSYTSLTSVISTSLIVFILIVLLGAICIVVITSFANFTNNKKESAILSILGSKRATLLSIYNLENIIISLFSCLVAFILSKPISVLLNKIIYSTFNLENIIVVPLFSYISLLFILLILLLSFISTLIPFIYYQSGYISEELKDE